MTVKEWKTLLGAITIGTVLTMATVVGGASAATSLAKGTHPADAQAEVKQAWASKRVALSVVEDYAGQPSRSIPAVRRAAEVMLDFAGADAAVPSVRRSDAALKVVVAGKRPAPDQADFDTASVSGHITLRADGRRWSRRFLGSYQGGRLVQDYKDFDDALMRSAFLRCGYVGHLAKLLADAGAGPVPLLLNSALHDDNTLLSRCAAFAMADVGTEACLDLLVEAVEDGRSPWSLSAGLALARLKRAGIPVLRKLLAHPKAEARMASARGLGRAGDRASVSALIELLKGQPPEVRSAASLALGEIGDPRAVEPLTEALKAPNALVHYTAAVALGDIGSPEAVPALEKLLADKNAERQLHALMALSEIGPPSVDALLRALSNKAPRVRAAAADALGAIGSDRAAVPVAALLQDESQWVRESAAMALVTLRDPRTIRSLISVWQWEDAFLRDQVSDTMIAMHSKAVPSLIDALDHDDTKIRVRAAEALGEIGDHRAAAALREVAQNDPSPFAKAAARAALERLATKRNVR